jgi:tetratricopeptide (TPR) repeat protein
MEWALRGQAFHSRDIELAEECVKAAIACDDKKRGEQILSRISDSLDGSLSAELHLAVARKQRSWGDLSAAERTLRNGLTKHASNAALEAELAAAAMDFNNWAEAESLWAAALAHSEAPQAGIFLGLVASLRAQGKIEEAIGVTSRGLDAVPGNEALARSLRELEVSSSIWREAVEQWVDQNSTEFGDALPLLPASPSLAQSSRDKQIVVYTCMFGTYEAPKEPLIRDPRVRWVLFTDNMNLQSLSWDVVQVGEIWGTTRRTSRLPKILPHVYLGEHHISLYIDASLEVKTPDIVKSCELMLGTNDIALYKHHVRDSVLDEIDVV